MHKLNIMLALAAGLSMAAAPAMADYPDRPITVIIPTSPGGGSDIGARTWGPFMEKCLGTTIVFVNKPGAGHDIGLTEMANSKPDGYTIGTMSVPNFPMNAITKKEPPYQLDSFIFFGSFYGSKVTINTRRGGKYADLPELIEAVKAGPVTMGISNFGSDDHIKMLTFMKEVGAQFTFIPFSDAASSRNAVLGGHVDVSGNSMAEVAAFQEDLLTLAIASEERVPELPDVPTFREYGLDIVGGGTHVMVGPKGIPSEIATKIATCASEVVQNPEFLAQAKQRAMPMSVRSASETTEWMAQEIKALQALWESDPW